MLARVLVVALCLSVRPSVSVTVGVLSKLVDGSNWLFGVEASFDQSHAVL